MHTATSIPLETIERVSHTLKTIAHPKRLMILCELSRWERSVGDLEKVCRISQSQLSQFLIKMKTEGLLDSNKVGTSVRYRIANIEILSLLQSLASIYCPHP